MMDRQFSGQFYKRDSVPVVVHYENGNTYTGHNIDTLEFAYIWDHNGNAPSKRSNDLMRKVNPQMQFRVTVVDQCEMCKREANGQS